MARYEVTETINGRTRIVATTRRENGAIHELDRAVESARANAARRRIGGWVTTGPTGRNPYEVVVVAADRAGDEQWTWYNIRRLGPDPEVEAADAALEDALLASIIALNGATL